MKDAKVSGYKKKSKKELLKAIDECSSLSQLFALIQHENIVIQMHTLPGASNLAPKVLTPKQIIEKKDTPFERLRSEVRKAVAARPSAPKRQTHIDKGQRNAKEK